MSLATELSSQAKPGSETRKILGPGGNRVQVFEEEKKKKNEGLKKKLASKTDNPILAKKLVCISPKGDDGIGTATKSLNSKKKVKEFNDLKKGSTKVVPDGAETLALSPLLVSAPIKRCDWITPNSGTYVF